MVSREEVVYAYRFLFGREPENENVITHYATEVRDLTALRELFMSSPEFRTSLERLQCPRPPKPPFVGPPMSVELLASEEKLAALFGKVSAQWHHLGETEPHWSVVTNESYFQENFHMNRAAFYASGEKEAEVFDLLLARAGIGRANLKRCVELGCGVGRVTLPLARRVASVLALDISSAHLRVAQAYAREEGADNIDFRHLSAVEEIDSIGTYDLLYSRIVLQHNPPPVIARLLNALLAQLRPGGIAHFQVPTYQAGYRFSIDDYLAQHNATDMEMHFFPQAALIQLLTDQHCQVLEIREDDAIGLSVTAISNTLLVQKRVSN